MLRTTLPGHPQFVDRVGVVRLVMEDVVVTYYVGVERLELAVIPHGREVVSDECSFRTAVDNEGGYRY